jgi:hypothetical protein
MPIRTPTAHKAAQFQALLAESEEERLIKQKKAEILEDKKADDVLLEQFNALTANVDQFESRLNSEENVSLNALLEAGSGSKAKASAKAKMSSEEQLQQEIEEEMDQDEGQDEEADEEEEQDADETFFLQFEDSVTAPTRSLKDMLASVEAPTAEDEILEPTMLEESEMEELTQSKDFPTSTFLMTNEELTAQLDNLAKNM